MPFSKHIDFGPDKTGSMWAGTFMYGPLVMAATGIKNWEDATIDVASDLSDVTLNGATEGKGAEANLYTLTYGGHTFIPDYAADRHVTHYFRMNVEAAPDSPFLTNNVQLPIDKSHLRELLLIAKSRDEEQQAWEALVVKVPEYAPWAKHGIARMREQMASARSYLDAPEGKYSQEETDQSADALNAIINTMRPGNLPEPEDLDELIRLLEKVNQLPEKDETAHRTISYANMVIRYVSDGSGTRDMIDRAIRQLNTILSR